MAQRMLPHKSSDLLDVMRTPSAPKNLGGFGRVSGSTASGGVRIGRRQAVLGASAMALFVALAFTAGVAVGRRHGSASGGSELTLARPSISGWVIRGWVPSISPATTQRLETAIPRDLQANIPWLSNRVRIERDDPRRDGMLTVVVTGFGSQDEAQRALDTLATWSVESCFPFRRGVVEPGR